MKGGHFELPYARRREMETGVARVENATPVRSNQESIFRCPDGPVAVSNVVSGQGASNDYSFAAQSTHTRIDPAIVVVLEPTTSHPVGVVLVKVGILSLTLAPSRWLKSLVTSS